MPEGAGYSGTPLPRKLGISDGDEVALIGAPERFEDTLGELPDVASLHTDLADDARYDVIVAFMTRRADLEADLPRLRAPDGARLRAVDRLAQAGQPAVHRPDRRGHPRGRAANRPGRQQGLRDRRNLVRVAAGHPS